ncbi:hypothetical protein OKA04_18705 [Luteolibacter flavescens]|uniref:Uncharacterized protein n=1 Tax=Luteolibacter flavescens TaxID=1859460 RepID=A0ABT3FTL7_9BACT|nr:hypothetical protein [Luteolibacter flavescens]MCW1886777.1 hypothetical protein [Luteolibacter flavescens]
MKKYRISDIPTESWIALTFMFWRQSWEFLNEYEALDGIAPDEVETTKYGIRIACQMSFLPEMDTYPAVILLSRPRFSSILDFNSGKLESATIRSSDFDHGVLQIEVE